MSFSDSDWTSEAAAAPAGRREGVGAWVGALALGIAIGAVGATLVFFALDRLPRREPAQEVAVARRSAAAEPQAAARVQPSLIDAAPPAAGPAPPTSAPASDASTGAPATTTLAPPAPGLSAEEKRRRERAWARFYQRPASCEGNPTTDQLIECANHFIRSKRDFDERWKAGTL